MRHGGGAAALVALGALALAGCGSQSSTSNVTAGAPPATVEPTTAAPATSEAAPATSEAAPATSEAPATSAPEAPLTVTLPASTEGATATATATTAAPDFSAIRGTFSSNCGACHTLKDANASGGVGPNLDQLKPTADAVQQQVANGGGGMPAFKGTLSDADIQAIAQYVSAVAGK